jgi:hypothetical protein
MVVMPVDSGVAKAACDQPAIDRERNQECDDER